MPVATWKYLPESVPADGTTVWVRLYNGYVEPFQAVYNSTTQQFTFTATAIIYPSWMIAKWRAI
jgi:hypothetical protein